MTKFSILIALLFTTSLAAQNNNKPCPCCAEGFRQFDFWLGDWEAFTPDGKLAGTNHIVLLQDSCIVQENWVSAIGKYRGTSYNFYNPTTKTWHQTWVDNQGGNLLLDGKYQDGKIILSSKEVKGQNGKSIFNRITWTPNTDGSVRQLWESSPDGKNNWTVAFDGLYKKKKE